MVKNAKKQKKATKMGYIKIDADHCWMDWNKDDTFELRQHTFFALKPTFVTTKPEYQS